VFGYEKNRVADFILALGISLSACGQDGEVKNVEIIYGSSEKFSKNEIKTAASCEGRL
jgi:hypothetical protein